MLISDAHEEDVEVLGQGHEHVEFVVAVKAVEDVVADVGLVVGDGTYEELAQGARDDGDEGAAVLGKEKRMIIFFSILR